MEQLKIHPSQMAEAWKSGSLSVSGLKFIGAPDLPETRPLDDLPETDVFVVDLGFLPEAEAGKPSLPLNSRAEVAFLGCEGQRR